MISVEDLRDNFTNMNDDEDKEKKCIPSVSLDYKFEIKFSPVYPTYGSGNERQLVEDLLSLLLGIQGFHVTASPLNTYHNQIRKFSISGNLSTSHRDLVKKVLPLAVAYSTLARFVERGRQLNAGRICHALSAKVDSYLTDLQRIVVNIDYRHRLGQIDLTTLWSDLEEEGVFLSVLARICHSISKSDRHGGAIITALYNEGAIAMDPDQKIYIRLLECASRSYLDMLEEWIYEGILYDPYEEFMIGQRELDPKYMSEIYWNDYYYIRENMIPSFLQPMKQKILDAGKYLDVVRRSRANRQLTRSSGIEHSLNTNDLLRNIDLVHDRAKKIFMGVLVNEFGLMSVLGIMKGCFLLERGDFFVRLIETCEDELCKDLSVICRGTLVNQFSLALRKFHTEGLEIKFFFEKKSITSQVKAVIASMAGNSLVDEDEEDVETGFDGFCLNVKTEWPVSLLLTESVITRYQMIFRIIFMLRYAALKLCRLGLRGGLCRLAYGLKHFMICLLLHILYAATADTITMHWEMAVAKPEFLEDWNSVTNRHDRFLSACADSFLSNRRIDLLVSLSRVTKNFADLVSFHPEVTQEMIKPHAEKYSIIVNRLSYHSRYSANAVNDAFNKIPFESYCFIMP